MNFGLSMTISLEILKEALNLEIPAKGFLYLLESFTSFAKEHNFKTIEIGTFPPFDYVILKEIKNEIQELLVGFDVINHLPSWEINLAYQNEELRKVAIAEIKNLIIFFKELDIDKFVMHPGSYSSMNFIYKLIPDKMLATVKESILEINTFAKDQSVQLSFENLGGSNLLFTKPEEFVFFAENGIELTIDTSHAMITSIDTLEFINKYYKNIVEMHFVDGKRNEPDYHLPLGDGGVDYKTLLKRLEEVSYPWAEAQGFSPRVSYLNAGL